MTSDPTTGEIVRALRYCVGKDAICGTACPAYLSEAGCRTAIMKNAADRLESQERELLQKTEELEEMQEAATVLHSANETHWTYIKELTARAESAERERDAAFDMLQDMRGCDECKHLARTWRDEPCNRCCREYSMFEPCGLPQDGEGKA